jgi:OTU domain-containing protein 3
MGHKDKARHKKSKKDKREEEQEENKDCSNKKNKKNKNQKKQQEVNTKKQDRITKRELRRLKNMKHENEWKSDLAKFEEQLGVYGLRLKIVKGDGNCLFRTLADQIEGREDNYMTYRQRIVEFITVNREYFEPFIEDDEKFDDYVKDMMKDAVWGGNLEIQAFSMLYQRNVVIHILGQPSYVVSSMSTGRTIHCSYHLGVLFDCKGSRSITIV